MSATDIIGVPLPSAAQLRGELPKETDVLVIGGGIAGAAMAYYLAVQGVEIGRAHV